MSEQYGVQVNVKIGPRTRDALSLVSEFEDVKPSELIRHWVREKLAEYRKDRLFLKFLEKKESDISHDKESDIDFSPRRKK